MKNRISIFPVSFACLKLNSLPGYILFFYFLVSNSFAQSSNNRADSIQNALRTATGIHKADLLINLCKSVLDTNTNKALELAQQANRLSEQPKYPKGLANSNVCIGRAYHGMEKLDLAREYYLKALPFFETIKDSKGIANTNNNIGNTYIQQTDYSNALKYHSRALTIREEMGDKQAMADSYNNLGNIYAGMSNHLKALTYHLKSLKIREDQNDTTHDWQMGIAMSYVNIGRIYEYLGNYSRAQECFLNALKIYKRFNEKGGESFVYSGIGAIYQRKQDYSNAISNYLKAIAIAEEGSGSGSEVINEYYQLGQLYYERATKNKDNPAHHTGSEDYNAALNYATRSLELSQHYEYKLGMANNTILIGNIYRQLGKPDLTISYLNKAVSICPLRNIKVATYEGLYLTYKEQKKYKEALDNYQLYIQLKDSLYNAQNSLKIEQLGAGFEEEKKEKERVLMKKLVENKHQLEIQKQKTMLISVIIGLFFFIIFSVFIYRSFRQKQKANIIITQQKTEVENAYKVIEEQKKLVDEHNKDITDSINYAKRIQNALLASETLLKNNLPEYFVLYKPKDIVSGDFYWATEVVGSSPLFLLCAGDCTGHGVPGAFMSLLNITKLNETINEKKIIRPDLVLNNVREEIIKALNPNNATEECNDGMDCALLSFDYKSPFEGGRDDVTLTYSAANNPIYIIRNKELIIGSANKMPVGKSPKEKELFALHTIELQKNDTIYALTDGYADQFGGKQGKKFKYKQLEELLLAHQDKPMIEQKKILNETIEQWKGSYEQVDDILIIGIKI